MYNEMIDFGNGVYGLALNLEEDEVGCVILGDYSQLKGDEASTTGKLLSVPVGMGLLGRVVDAIGNPIDGKGWCSPTRTIRLTVARVSSRASPWISRCRPVSWRLTR